MSLVERCIYQFSAPVSHVLFKEEWERCKKCAYDPENNKRCANYSPTSYDVYDKKSEKIYEETEKKPEPVFELELNLSALPISQN